MHNKNTILSTILVICLLLFVSISQSLHTISRRISETQELNESEVKNITRDESTFNTSAIDFADNTTNSNSSGISNSIYNTNNKKIDEKTVLETIVSTESAQKGDEEAPPPQTSAPIVSNPTNLTSSSTLSSTLDSIVNITESQITDSEVIDSTADMNSTKSNYFYQLFRFERIKLKITELENKITELMNKNLFYSIAIPAALGVAVAMSLLLIFFCCKGCGHCSGRCCYRLLCCCRNKNRRNNRLKYAKSKHLFGDEKNYLLVNNESDAEIET